MCDLVLLSVPQSQGNLWAQTPGLPFWGTTRHGAALFHQDTQVVQGNPPKSPLFQPPWLHCNVIHKPKFVLIRKPCRESQNHVPSFLPWNTITLLSPLFFSPTEGNVWVQDCGELQLIPAKDVSGTWYHRYVFPTQGKSLQAVLGKSKINACVFVLSTQERYLTSKLLSHKVPNSSHPRWNFVAEMTHQICLAWITTKSNYRITSWACFFMVKPCGGKSRGGQTCQS